MKRLQLRKFDMLLLALVIVSLAIGVLAGLWIAGSSAPVLPTQHISGLFLDVNGDGLPDYIWSGEVIFNPGPLSPTQPIAP
jgi:hypothetical protein